MSRVLRSVRCSTPSSFSRPLWLTYSSVSCGTGSRPSILVSRFDGIASRVSDVNPSRPWSLVILLRPSQRLLREPSVERFSMSRNLFDPSSKQVRFVKVATPSIRATLLLTKKTSLSFSSDSSPEIARTELNERSRDVRFVSNWNPSESSSLFPYRSRCVNVVIFDAIPGPVSSLSRSTSFLTCVRHAKSSGRALRRFPVRSTSVSRAFSPTISPFGWKQKSR
mmetsp:Transcript_30412/g.72327  ORF Transcript_30412/g.72327 Transcript_30412/m.72327 type:complete len:223 (-) Transcript_30412:228-896(-)